MNLLQKKVLPEYQPIVQHLREIISKVVPEVEESISYGIPVFRVRNIIAVISPTKKDITLSFSKGAEMEDRYKLLGGVGKVSKYIKFKSQKEISIETISYYLKQAVKIDAKTNK